MMTYFHNNIRRRLLAKVKPIRLQPPPTDDSREAHALQLAKQGQEESANWALVPTTPTEAK